MHSRAPPDSSVYETQENPAQPSLWSNSTGPSCCLLSARHPHLRSQCFIGNICSCLGESSWSCALATSPSAVPKSIPAPFCPQGTSRAGGRSQRRLRGTSSEPPMLPHSAGALFLTQSSRNMPWYLHGALSDTVGVLNDWTHSMFPSYLVNLATNMVVMRGGVTSSRKSFRPSTSPQRSEVSSGLSLATLNATKAPKICSSHQPCHKTPQIPTAVELARASSFPPSPNMENQWPQGFGSSAPFLVFFFFALFLPGDLNIIKGIHLE